MQDFKLNKLYIFRKYMNKNQRVIDFQLKLGTLVHEVLHGLPADVQNVWRFILVLEKKRPILEPVRLGKLLYLCYLILLAE